MKAFQELKLKLKFKINENQTSICRVSRNFNFG